MNFIAIKHYTAAAAFITKKSTMAEEWQVTQNPKWQSWLNQQPDLSAPAAHLQHLDSAY